MYSNLIQAVHYLLPGVFFLGKLKSDGAFLHGNLLSEQLKDTQQDAKKLNIKHAMKVGINLFSHIQNGQEVKTLILPPLLQAINDERSLKPEGY